MIRVIIFLFSFIFLFYFCSISYSKEVITQRELIEILTKLQEGQKNLEKRLEDTNKRIDDLRADMNKRFEMVERRFESIDKRFDQMIKLFSGIVASFVVIVAITIGFALWDRRTMIRPFEKEVRSIKEKIKELDEEKIGKINLVLKKASEKDKELAEILRSIGLL